LGHEGNDEHRPYAATPIPWSSALARQMGLELFLGINLVIAGASWIGIAA
jgi:hypothetical protein